MAVDRPPIVAFYSPSLAGGGAERQILNLARGFAERGVAVDLVLASAAGPYLDDVPPSVRLVDLRCSRVLTSLLPLVSYLRREKPDAMFAAQCHANIIAVWARRMARVPTRLVVSERDTGAPKFGEASNRKLSQRMMPLLRHRFYPWADAIHAVSKDVADRLCDTSHLPREKITVIHNPVVRPDLAVKARQPLDHPWFGPDEPPVILTVGRLTRQKDHATLLRASALLREQCSARLLILGEGEARAELEQLARSLGIEQQVDMRGFVGNPYAYMARAAVFVLSSAWEDLPGVLIEAMACGCPVVSTDCPGGSKEILDNGRFGQLVPVGDHNAMAAAIRLALDQGRGDAARAAQARAMDFNAECATDAYQAILFPLEDQA